MKSLCFTLNGEDFWIDEFDAGFAWVSKGNHGKFWPTQAEAQQEAIDYVCICEENQRAAEEEAIDDRLYGTYEQQKRAEYNYQIRH